MAAGWLGDRATQIEVEKRLTQFRLDENSIEAEAWRLVSDELDLLEWMLTLLEHRRDKTLTTVGNYRNGLAKQIKQAAQRIVDFD